MSDHPLDNPVWHSLSETHAGLSIRYKHIRFYHPDYCPFGGFDQPHEIADAIDQYSLLTDNFFIVGEQPDLSGRLIIKNELVCLQMIFTGDKRHDDSTDIVELSPAHQRDLFQLVNLVQPGYFKEKTASLGQYFGIFENNQLVAVTGERMKMNDFVEVSAVVTHPDHLRKGYAKQLVMHGVNNILNQNKTPYLHVVETNAGAIGLYEKLGFTTRRRISFWHVSPG
jgi:ribosomal protein S18 acetylase RimI-like enzyme